MNSHSSLNQFTILTWNVWDTCERFIYFYSSGILEVSKVEDF